jgi:SNW domain-containing protein 1
MNSQVARSFQPPPALPSSAPRVTTVKFRADSEYTVRIADKPVDPLDPSHFRNRKTMHLQESDPPPVLTDPAPKLTAAEEQAWNVPACVSNWKNPEGYVIPMDKRVGADARRFEQPGLSERFGVFAKALGAASSSIRESIAQRNLLERQIAQRKQEEEEAQMLEEAKRLHAEMQQIRKEKTREERMVDQMLEDHREQRERLRRKNRELANRDTSEQVALGIPLTAQMVDDEFDGELYGKTGGIDAGYGQEDEYQVYEKPLFAQRKEYVAGARGGGRYAETVTAGQAPVVKFTKGEKQVVDQRAGVFFSASDAAKQKK